MAASHHQHLILSQTSAPKPVFDVSPLQPFPHAGLPARRRQHAFLSGEKAQHRTRNALNFAVISEYLIASLTAGDRLTRQASQLRTHPYHCHAAISQLPAQSHPVERRLKPLGREEKLKITEEFNASGFKDVLHASESFDTEVGPQSILPDDPDNNDLWERPAAAGLREKRSDASYIAVDSLPVGKMNSCLWENRGSRNSRVPRANCMC